jgi:hypothetical protein
MIVQAIALLDDLDKEINIYSMRVKEWYGERPSSIVARSRGSTSPSRLASCCRIPRYRSAVVESLTGKISKTLKKFLTDEVSGNKKLKKEQLVVSEPKLGSRGRAGRRRRAGSRAAAGSRGTGRPWSSR